MPRSEVAGNTQNVSSKGIRREISGRGKAARQALKEADMKPFPYKSPAQFWPRLLATTRQYSGTQSEPVACKEQIHLTKTLEESLPLGGNFGAGVEQAGRPRPEASAQWGGIFTLRKALPSRHTAGWWEQAQPGAGTEAGGCFPGKAPGRGTSPGLAPRGTVGSPSPRHSRSVALWCARNDFSLCPLGEVS